jgi:D-tyrosyl-tRNA(Tyr) deacylase
MLVEVPALKSRRAGHRESPNPRIPNPESMIALIQRVLSAQVDVDDDTVGAIGPGLLALVAVQADDGEVQTRRMLQRLLGYRVFSDDAGRMNRSLTDTGGQLLLVSQFTLAADTRSGMRPSFTTAAPPEHARQWFDRLLELARDAHPGVETGRFGAHMKIQLVNDGPVTFWLGTGQSP